MGAQLGAQRFWEKSGDQNDPRLFNRLEVKGIEAIHEFFLLKMVAQDTR
jgi:hypothetical protein